MSTPEVGSFRQLPEQKNSEDKEYIQYERLVREVQQALLNEQGLKHIKAIHHGKILGKSGLEHQVDVYWEYEHQGQKFATVLECKHYAKPVEISLVREMSGLRADVPNIQIVIVTTKGYQEGAVTLAKYHQIGLRLVRPAQAKDLDGRAFERQMEETYSMSELVSFQIEPDFDWVRANLSTEEIVKQKGKFKEHTASVFVFDKISNIRLSLLELQQKLPLDLPNSNDSGAKREHRFDWEYAYIEIPDRQPMKIHGIIFTYRWHSGVNKIQVGSRDIARTLVRDVLENKTLFIDEAGIVTGDKELLDDPYNNPITH